MKFSIELDTRHRLFSDKLGEKVKFLCPVHEEKTPSFIVDTHKMRYRCLGCGIRGDVLHIDREELSED